MTSSTINRLICPVCAHQVVREDKDPGVLCKSCGLLINVAAKPLDYTNGHGQNPPDKKKMQWRRVNARRRLALIEPFMHGQRVLVDIGCGSGEMLLEGSSIFPQVLGFEVNLPLVDYARKQYGLNILASNFDRNALPAALATAPKVFTLSHVIEHLAVPATLLAEIRLAARPGDLLYVEVPLHTGESFRELGYDWALWNDEHLMLFSPESLRHLLLSAGFTVANQGVRIFARGSNSSKTRFRLFRQNPMGFFQALTKRKSYLSVADLMIADYGYIVARI